MRPPSSRNCSSRRRLRLDELLRLRDELRGSLHLIITRSGEDIVAAGLFTEYRGIIQALLVGTDDRYRRHSPLKLHLDDVRRWGKARGDLVLHLGGGRGGSEDSLFAFKSRFSRRRHAFHTGRWVLDRVAYQELVAARERWLAKAGDPPPALGGSRPSELLFETLERVAIPVNGRIRPAGRVAIAVRGADRRVGGMPVRLDGAMAQAPTRLAVPQPGDGCTPSGAMTGAVRFVAMFGTRDDVELITAAIAHLRRIGVDLIVIYDAGSVDGTLDVIAKEEAKGDVWLFHVPPGLAPVPLRTEKAIALARSVRAEWVLFLDPDEFVLPSTGSLSDLPELAENDILTIERFDVAVSRGRV